MYFFKLKTFFKIIVKYVQKNKRKSTKLESRIIKYSNTSTHFVGELSEKDKYTKTLHGSDDYICNINSIYIN